MKTNEKLYDPESMILCLYHSRWTHLCVQCDLAESNRRLRRASGYGREDDGDWIFDPNLK